MKDDCPSPKAFRSISNAIRVLKTTLPKNDTTTTDKDDDDQDADDTDSKDKGTNSQVHKDKKSSAESSLTMQDTYGTSQDLTCDLGDDWLGDDWMSFNTDI